MTVTAELFTNPGLANPVVTVGGSTTPVSGTSETWTVTGLSVFPAVSSAATPPTYCRCCDPALPAEILWITNISGTTVTITRGAEGTTTLNHGTGFQLELLITAGQLGNFAQGWPGLISTLTAKSTTYTATAADNIIVCNAAGAGFTVNLPTAIGALGRTYTIKKTDSSANAVTVDPFSTQTIDGAATYSLFAQWQSVTVVSDGANWQVTSVRLYLDTTAADIAPLGTQAAGASGLAADAKHVHAMPRLDQVLAPTAAVALGAQKITGLANGTASTDAAAFGQLPSIAGLAALSGATFTGPVTVTGFGEAVVSKSANYTATSADSVILCNAAGGVFTIALPTAAGIAGRIYTLKKTDTTTNVVTVDGSGSETIDGAIVAPLWAPGQVLVIVSDGTNWQILSGGEVSAVSGTAINMTTQTTPTTMSPVLSVLAGEPLVAAEYEFEIGGVITPPASGTVSVPTYTMAVYIDGTSTVLGGQFTLGAAYLQVGQNYGFTFRFWVIITVTGSSGTATCIADGQASQQGVNLGNTLTMATASSVGTGKTYNTTTAHTLQICGAWSSTGLTGHKAVTNRARTTRR